MTIDAWPKIREQGKKDFYKGVERHNNPFQFCSLKYHGPQKGAVWLAGWEEAKKEKNQVHK